MLVKKLTSDPQTSAIDTQNYLTGIFIILAVFIGALSITSWQMGERGWDTGNAAEKKARLGWLVGVNFLGFVLLVVAFVLTGDVSP